MLLQFAVILVTVSSALADALCAFNEVDVLSAIVVVAAAAAYTVAFGMIFLLSFLAGLSLTLGIAYAVQRLGCPLHGCTHNVVSS